MPCSRHSSGTGVPASACLSTAMIWLSVKRDFFMGTSSGNRTRKFHFWRQLTCGGITVARAETMLGQLLLGVLAEQAFEHIYRTTIGTTELSLEDDRGARNDTDYRVLNGGRRQVFRINIKLHGARFRNAKDMV